jgi:hypothetical protein
VFDDGDMDGDVDMDDDDGMDDDDDMDGEDNIDWKRHKLQQRRIYWFAPIRIVMSLM